MIFNVGTSVFFKVVLPLNRAPGAELRLSLGSEVL